MSGGSEANNLALIGSYFARRGRGHHIVTQATEHPAILEPLAFLERLGAAVTYLQVDGIGQVDPDTVKRAITPRTILITIMHANNETGTIPPIEEIGAIAQEHGVRFHTGAAQSVGKIPTKVDALGVDLLSVAGHKLHAPKGVGALYVRDEAVMEPLICGAGHADGRRAGTESALLATALGAACDLAQESVVGLVPKSLRKCQHHRFDGIGLPRRADHGVACTRVHAGGAGDRHGSGALRSRTPNDTG
ncbi:MAG TPA: aminotransferase class V-fold PLP-dependent enzyme [Rhodopila sp.]|uniref:cysteine desulfurase family protein n=1 Tax=Rhodopila sp. TaxID=2480087 RepID=UPI002CDDBA13|nr:aminotransferase class V-fold PLP-dependent enzyme [Rhodopila sp.]HVY13932.1 aminotransferase class V-fold PLP-dependent enzyme [Rhodopila sp.]